MSLAFQAQGIAVAAILQVVNLPVPAIVLSGSMRGPELMAQTLEPASHRIFMAVPPPAPVPTTIAS